MRDCTQSLVLLYLQDIARSHERVGGWARLSWLREEFGVASAGAESEEFYDALEALAREGLVEVQGLLWRVTDRVIFRDGRLRTSLLAN